MYAVEEHELKSEKERSDHVYPSMLVVNAEGSKLEARQITDFVF